MIQCVGLYFFMGVYVTILVLNFNLCVMTKVFDF
jgi:hypothetical protein